MEKIDIKRAVEHELLMKANVVGVMLGYKITDGARTSDLSIICMVEKKISKDKLGKKDLIPGIIKGVETDVIQVGKLKALNIDPQARHRPCPMGTSGGHHKITAGTNGELLRDKVGNKTCIGTNNHVGANSNDAEIGDPYLQPGPADGGSVENDRIGSLLRFVPIKFSGGPSECPIAGFFSNLMNYPAKHLGRKTRLRPMNEGTEYNLVDAALIEVNENDVLSEIIEIGIPKGVNQANLDMLVQKSGRTTGHTIDGLVTGIDATVGPISYGLTQFAYFKDQIIITKEGFSSGGDSGSLVLDMDGYAIGKLFAGSDAENITIANQMDHYLSQLNAELVTE
jgi:hypothetical protein